MSGLDIFISSCSDSIQKRGCDLSNDDYRSLLYLMKFLCQNWSNPEKEPRQRTKLCLKMLFIILLTEKYRPEWTQLLEQSVIQIAEHWKISREEYPFLREDEKNYIISLVDTISQQPEIHEKFSFLEIEKKCLKPEWCYFPANICNEFIESYKEVYGYQETDNNDIRQLKAFFIAVQEANITNTFTAIMKTLPIHFCIAEIRRLRLLTPADHKTDHMADFLSGQVSDFVYRKKLFIKKNIEETVDYRPVPMWAEWLFLAGQKIAMDSSLCGNGVVGFSLPTRSYAVLFFLLGYETWNAEKKMQDSNGDNSYFKYLSECEQDEALLIWENQRWKRCWFKGIETAAGEKCIKVNVPGAEAKRHNDYIPESKIFKLRKAVDPERAIAANQIGFEMTGSDSLVCYYNKKEDNILRFLITEKISYAVVGNISALKKEITQETIYCRSAGKYTEMSFQDIIRFKNFMTDFDLSRGMILSSLSNKENGDLAPPLLQTVIYDGSLAYLNRQQDIKNNMEIVFLDRTESQFSNARDQLMERYSDREDDMSLFGKIPASAEVVAFKE